MKTRGHRGFGRSRWVIVFLVGGAAMFAQQVLDNDAILKLVRTGLSEEIILSIVSHEPGTYSVTADDLLKLKNAGVPDLVAAAMIQKQRAMTAAPVALLHPSWMSAPIPQWSEEDAKQLL